VLALNGTDIHPERRSEERLPALLTCTIRILDDVEVCSTACIVDFSCHGMGLVTSVPLTWRSAVAVQYAGVLMLAEVRSCTPDGRAFRIGLLLDQAIATADARLSVAGAVREIETVLASASEHPLESLPQEL
jgi:hypothetical protein